jgi:hypothetical protein
LSGTGKIVYTPGAASSSRRGLGIVPAQNVSIGHLV